MPIEGVVASSDAITSKVCPYDDPVSGKPMEEAGAPDYQRVIGKGTMALHGGVTTSYRACPSWYDADRRNGSYELSAKERGYDYKGKGWMFHYRDHYFHDIFYPQFADQVVAGAQAPDTARGLGLTGPVHLRIIHPTVLYEEWWWTTYCMEWAGGRQGGDTWPLLGNLGKKGLGYCQSYSHSHAPSPCVPKCPLSWWPEQRHFRTRHPGGPWKLDAFD